MKTYYFSRASNHSPVVTPAGYVWSAHNRLAVDAEDEDQAVAWVMSHYGNAWSNVYEFLDGDDHMHWRDGIADHVYLLINGKDVDWETEVTLLLGWQEGAGPLLLDIERGRMATREGLLCWHLDSEVLRRVWQHPLMPDTAYVVKVRVRQWRTPGGQCLVSAVTPNLKTVHKMTLYNFTPALGPEIPLR